MKDKKDKNKNRTCSRIRYI